LELATNSNNLEFLNERERKECHLVKKRSFRILSQDYVLRLSGVYTCSCNVLCEFIRTVKPPIGVSFDATIESTKARFPFLVKPELNSNTQKVFFALEAQSEDGNPKNWNGYNITMTYSKNSTIPLTYNDKDLIVPEQQSEPSHFMLFLSSRCVEERDNFVSELMKYVPIHSLGKCMNNGDAMELFPECRNSFPERGNYAWRDTKFCLMSRFKFVLAVENTIATDYVTEKFFDVLQTNSVLVYKGAPNAQDYAPGNNSFIDTSQFPNLLALSKYLLELRDNKELYQRFQEWRNKPLNPNWQSMRDHSFTNAPCLLCEYLSKNS